MFDNRKVTVVMPAFNAASTLQIAYEEVMTQAVVDLIILVGDVSHDATCRHCPNHGQSPSQHLFALVIIFFQSDE